MPSRLNAHQGQSRDIWRHFIKAERASTPDVHHRPTRIKAERVSRLNRGYPGEGRVLAMAVGKPWCYGSGKAGALREKALVQWRLPWQ